MYAGDTCMRCKGIPTPSVSVSGRLDPIRIHCDAWKWGNQFPSVTNVFSGIQSAADADAAADARYGCSLMLCSHLTSAFASTSTSLSKFNIASTVMQT